MTTRAYDINKEIDKKRLSNILADFCRDGEIDYIEIDNSRGIYVVGDSAIVVNLYDESSEEGEDPYWAGDVLIVGQEKNIESTKNTLERIIDAELVSIDFEEDKNE